MQASESAPFTTKYIAAAERVQVAQHLTEPNLRYYCYCPYWQAKQASVMRQALMAGRALGGDTAQVPVTSTFS